MSISCRLTIKKFGLALVLFTGVSSLSGLPAMGQWTDQEEKDRLRPIIRSERKKKASTQGPIRRRSRTYSDFKDEDDK